MSLPQAYFYRPLKAFNGLTLKCEGLCTDQNRDWFPKDCVETDVYLDGVFLANAYLGDRIPAQTQGLEVLQ